MSVELSVIEKKLTEDVRDFEDKQGCRRRSTERGSSFDPERGLSALLSNPDAVGLVESLQVAIRSGGSLDMNKVRQLESVFNVSTKLPRAKSKKPKLDKGNSYDIGLKDAAKNGIIDPRVEAVLSGLCETLSQASTYVRDSFNRRSIGQYSRRVDGVSGADVVESVKKGYSDFLISVIDGDAERYGDALLRPKCK